MAKRIAIVLSQLKGASPAQRDLEGSVVAELLMVHGLEVTLVADLTALDDDDTGVLCLEGITGDMVLLSWMSSDDAHQHLAARGIQGRLGRTATTQDIRATHVEDNDSPRTIYHIDLRSIHEVKDCCTEIERIRDEASVQVIGLGLISPAEAKPSEVQGSTGNDRGLNKSAPTPSPSDQVKSNTLKPAQAPPTPADIDDDDPELDALMEQFDAWDV